MWIWLDGARYKVDGKIVEVPEGELLLNAKPMDLLPALNLEGLPNRDSLSYAQQYGIADTVQTILRGTLRFKVTFLLLNLIY